MKRNPNGAALISKRPGYKIGGFRVTGFDVSEIGAMAAGGAIYGFINGALPRIPLVGQLQMQLMRVPVVGTALTPLLVGAFSLNNRLDFVESYVSTFSFFYIFF